MATITVGFCIFPIPGFSFSLPALPSFSIPFPILDFNIDFTCPIN